MNNTRDVKKRGGRGLARRIWRHKTLLLMLAAPVTLTFVFAYLPMGGLLIAFKRFNYAQGILGSPWVGLSNFAFFFQSGRAWLVTRNTALYNLGFILVNTVLELTLAIILGEMTLRWLKRTLQSFIFLPYFISWVIVGSIAYSLFSYENGVLNGILQGLGLAPVNVYGEPAVWPLIILAFSAWKGVGYGMVVYLAAIAGIDGSLYEAATIDGATIFQRVWHITLPSVAPTMITLVLLALGKVFRGNLDLFYQLVGQNGLLFNTTDVIDTVVFRMTITATDIGQTVAIGFFQSCLCLVTILAANGVVRRVEENYALF